MSLEQSENLKICFEISQMLHDERNLNRSLKRNLSDAKINLYQERLRIQQLQTLNEKLIRQHKLDVKRINNLQENISGVDTSYLQNKSIKVSCCQDFNIIDKIKHYENLIEVLQDQVDIIMNDRDTTETDFMCDFVSCQKQIELLNIKLLNLESQYSHNSKDLEKCETNILELKEENNTLHESYIKTLKIKELNSNLTKRNKFLITENAYYQNQLKTMESLVERLKSYRTHLLEEVHALKLKIVQNEESYNTKICRLSKEICSLRYRSHKLNCRELVHTARNRECVCEQIQL